MSVSTLRTPKGHADSRKGMGVVESRQKTSLPGRLFDVGCLLYGRCMIVTASGCTEGPVTS